MRRRSTACARRVSQPVRPLGCQGDLDGPVPGSRAGRRPARSRPDGLVCREGPPLGRRRERGEQSQAIGRSRGGRSTKIHALTDRYCRPIAFLLTGGQVADCKAAAALLEHLPSDARVLHGDKGYDTNPVRQQVEANGTLPNIPPKANRIWKSCFSPVLYRARNAIEMVWSQLTNSA